LVRPDQGKCTRLDRVLLAVGGPDAVRAVPRPSLAQDGGERELLDRNRVAPVAQWPERSGPLLCGHLAALLERATEQRPGGLVVEEQAGIAVDENCRRRDARQQVAGEDELEGFLGSVLGHSRVDSSTQRMCACDLS